MIQLIRMQRLIRYNILRQDILPSNSGKDSFIHVIYCLFTKAMANIWSMLARIPKVDLRIFKIVLEFTIIACGRIHSTKRIGLEVGRGVILFFLPVYNLYFNDRVLFYNLTNLILKNNKYTVIFLDKFEPYIFQDTFILITNLNYY